MCALVCLCLLCSKVGGVAHQDVCDCACMCARVCTLWVRTRVYQPLCACHACAHRYLSSKHTHTHIPHTLKPAPGLQCAPHSRSHLCLCTVHAPLILNTRPSCSMRSTAAPYHGSTACIAWQVMRHFTACPGGGHAPGGHAPRREICSSTPPSCPHHPRTYVHTRACMHTFISCEHVLSCKHMHRSGLFCAQAAHLCCSGLSRIVQHGLELWLRGVSRGLDMRSAETGRGN